MLALTPLNELFMAIRKQEKAHPKVALLVVEGF
jgi:hypothetical protein